MIIGAGLMGPAAAFNAASDPEVTEVLLCDLDRPQLREAEHRMPAGEASGKIAFDVLDVADRKAAAERMKKFDVVLTALPWQAVVPAVRAALDAGVPLVDLAIPDDDDMAMLRRETEQAGGFVLLGCGLEPGLTEIFARHLAEQLDQVERVWISVGGIPEHPEPPMNYNIVFGGRRMPYRENDVTAVVGGRHITVPRYSGVEQVHFEGVGICEAWHEGVIPWLLDLEVLKDVPEVSQKTIRYPGYAATASLFRDLGLLSMEPVEVDGTEVIPKHVVDAVLYPRVAMKEGGRDITLFRVEVEGTDGEGRNVMLRAEMVDRFDPETGFTSMARTTAFTGAIAARLIGKGKLKGHGLTTPDRLFTSALFDALVDLLAQAGVTFNISTREPGSSQ